LCEDDYRDNAPITIASDDNQILGNILPGNSPTDLASFWQDGSEFVLSFHPLLPFLDTNDTPDDPTDDTRIKGIPFSIDTAGTAIPQSSYTITADVNIGNYQKTITAVVPENVSIGAFDYVIFE